ncbi:MAG TPA: hypothetical protein VNE38_18175 [Ktedonobacteraceae bacterium]|nr:hypothetical protein [Ktedonobacteraceae bacterium]
MTGIAFNIHDFSPYLGALGLLGTIILLATAGTVFWRYRDCRVGSFQWRVRDLRLKQVTAVACLFFLAMAASYWVIQEPLGWVYLLVAFTSATWWFRRAISRGI